MHVGSCSYVAIPLKLFVLHIQLLGHLLQVAKQVAGKEGLEDGYRIGMSCTIPHALICLAGVSY